MSEELCYVYGIVDASTPLDQGGGPDGIEEGAVRLEPEGGIAALVTSVDGTSYSAEALERATADVEWIGPRALAHDRVLTWASDRGPVVPLPMFSLFRDAAGVRAMLRARAEELRTALDRVSRGREYALRLYRLDAALRTELATLSDRVAALEAEMARATPGQRYLLGRKLEAERTAEARRVSQEVARDVYAALAERSVAAASDPIPQGTRADAPGTMVLNAAFLVADGAYDGFRATLTTLVGRHQGRGFHFDFTGPWPPYHFAGSAAEREVTA